MVGRRGGWITAVVALVIVAAGCTSSHKAKVEQGKVTVVGTPLPDHGDGHTDAAIGMQAPIVTGVGFDGKPVRLAADGKPTVIIFLTPGPQFPQRLPGHIVDEDNLEARGLVALWKKKGLPAGVRVLAVSSAGAGTKSVSGPPSKWFAQRDWPVPTLADDRFLTAVRTLSGGDGIALLRADGTVADRIEGFGNDGWPVPISDFNDAVRSLLGLEPGYNVP